MMNDHAYRGVGKSHRSSGRRCRLGRKQSELLWRFHAVEGIDKWQTEKAGRSQVLPLIRRA